MHCTALSLLVSTLAYEPHALCDERFIFHQLLAGRDVAVPEHASDAQQYKVFSMAKSMQVASKSHCPKTSSLLSRCLTPNHNAYPDSAELHVSGRRRSDTRVCGR